MNSGDVVRRYQSSSPRILELFSHRSNSLVLFSYSLPHEESETHARLRLKGISRGQLIQPPAPSRVSQSSLVRATSRWALPPPRTARAQPLPSVRPAPRQKSCTEREWPVLLLVPTARPHPWAPRRGVLLHSSPPGISRPARPP